MLWGYRSLKQQQYFHAGGENSLFQPDSVSEHKADFITNVFLQLCEELDRFSISHWCSSQKATTAPIAFTTSRTERLEEKDLKQIQEAAENYLQAGFCTGRSVNWRQVVDPLNHFERFSSQNRVQLYWNTLKVQFIERHQAEVDSRHKSLRWLKSSQEPTLSPPRPHEVVQHCHHWTSWTLNIGNTSEQNNYFHNANSLET